MYLQVLYKGTLVNRILTITEETPKGSEVLTEELKFSLSSPLGPQATA
jgi:hypothetical protein